MDYRVEEAHLSDRERTVLLMAADGLTDKEIAASLGLSLKTIHTYWDRMRQKMSASTRTQVLARYLRSSGNGKAEEEGLRQVFASSDEGVWLLDGDGNTIYANAGVARMFGYAADDFPSQPPSQVLRAVGAPDLYQRMMSISSESADIESALQFKDGRRHWLRLKASMVKDEHGQRHSVALLVRDVSIEKQIEHALSSCETTLSNFADLSSDCVAKFDHELHCTYVNPALCNSLDVPEKLIVGQHVHQLQDIFSPNRIWADALTTAVSTGTKQEFVIPSNNARPDRHTWLLPEPTFHATPRSILSISRSL